MTNNPKLTQLTAHAMWTFFVMFPMAGFQIKEQEKEELENIDFHGAVLEK